MDIPSHRAWAPFSSCNGTQYSYVPNNPLTFSFVGTSFTIWSTSSLEGGLITVTMDDETPVNFDRYSPTTLTCDMVAFNRDGMNNGSHTFTMRRSGISPMAASSARAYVDWERLTYTVLDESDVIGASSSIVSVTNSTGSQPVPTSTSTTSSTPQTSRSNAGAIAGGVIGAIVAVLLGCFLWWYCTRKKPYQAARGADPNITARPGAAAPSSPETKPLANASGIPSLDSTAGHPKPASKPATQTVPKATAGTNAVAAPAPG